MGYLLDTNVMIALFKNDHRIWERVRRYHVKDFAISIVTLHELYYGAYYSDHVEANLQKLANIPFDALELGLEDARCAGNIRAVLTRAGTPIGPLDTLIAGQAVARGLTMITRNVREFARVERLRVENWEE